MPSWAMFISLFVDFNCPQRSFCDQSNRLPWPKGRWLLEEYAWASWCETHRSTFQHKAWDPVGAQCLFNGGVHWMMSLSSLSAHKMHSCSRRKRDCLTESRVRSDLLGNFDFILPWCNAWGAILLSLWTSLDTVKSYLHILKTKKTERKKKTSWLTISVKASTKI
jgi:hypothetical protein